MEDTINSKISNKWLGDYNRLNKILLLWLVLIFLYPIFANRFRVNYQCQYKAKYHKDCISCGLTRGFSECLHGNFKEATLLNKYSTFLFTGVICQIFLRVILLLMPPNRTLLFADIVISVSPIVVYAFLFG